MVNKQINYNSEWDVELEKLRECLRDSEIKYIEKGISSEQNETTMFDRLNILIKFYEEANTNFNEFSINSSISQLHVTNRIKNDKLKKLKRYKELVKKQDESIN
ncbi:hypothetical protein [Enterococcus faecalis]|uniref:hypothetical protein n=1 Tax=Enterococcus faecalis TaxID=1351 RepID=UPI0013310715|nr:hypothetical protein [Enterococcus faecalis]CAG4707050.1 Uncharacterised protein [Enterococcus faecalis]